MALAYTLVGVLLVGGLLLGVAILVGLWFGVSGSRPELLEKKRRGGRCAACGGDELLQFDHVIPVALGGSSTPENLQLLCAPCNREKGAGL